MFFLAQIGEWKNGEAFGFGREIDGMGKVRVGCWDKEGNVSENKFVCQILSSSDQFLILPRE